MASILRKVLRNRSQPFTTRIITNLNKIEPAIVGSPPPILSHPSCSTHVQLPFFLQPGTQTSNLKLSPSSVPYPTFSFGNFLNPISPNELIYKSENDEGAVSEDSRKIWADSVKKKRKKKMNKHKLKKLRKRLRRKT